MLAIARREDSKASEQDCPLTHFIRRCVGVLVHNVCENARGKKCSVPEPGDAGVATI